MPSFITNGPARVDITELGGGGGGVLIVLAIIVCALCWSARHVIEHYLIVAAIGVSGRSRLVIVMASFLGFVAFLWPFVVAPHTFGDNAMAPLMFGALLVLVIAIVFSEMADGGMFETAGVSLEVIHTPGYTAGLGQETTIARAGQDFDSSAAGSPESSG